MTSNPYSSVECRLEPILVLVISYTGGPGKNLSQTVGVVPSLSQATPSVFRYGSRPGTYYVRATHGRGLARPSYRWSTYSRPMLAEAIWWPAGYLI